MGYWQSYQRRFGYYLATVLILIGLLLMTGSWTLGGFIILLGIGMIFIVKKLGKNKSE